MSAQFQIAPVPNDLVPAMWPAMGPHLAIGASVDPEVDLEVGVKRVLDGLAQIWVAYHGDLVALAWITSVVFLDDEKEETALDIYNMGGSQVLKMRHALCAVMREYALANNCTKIIFRGRPALARIYAPLGNLKAVKTDPDGTVHFENKLN